MHASAREQASCCSLHLLKVSLLLTIVVKVYVLPLLRFFCCERLSAGVWHVLLWLCLKCRYAVVCCAMLPAYACSVGHFESVAALALRCATAVRDIG
jgi:hypothetical protein